MRRGIFFGVIGTVLAFAGLSLMWHPSVAARAEVLTTPPAGRFELVNLHPNANSEWSGVLDTETGCVWVFGKNDPNDPAITSQPYKSYLQILGNQSFDVVNFDAMDYVTPQTGTGGQTYAPDIREINRVQTLCSNARVQAIEAAATH